MMSAEELNKILDRMAKRKDTLGDWSNLYDQAKAALELRDMLDWAIRYGDWAEACTGNPIMGIMYDKAKETLSRYEV